MNKHAKTAPNLLNVNGEEKPVDDGLIREDECGLILSTDGSFRLFSTVQDAHALTKPVEQMSEIEQARLLMGQKLTCLSMALQNEQVMDVLLELLSNASALNSDEVEDAPRH